MKPYDAVDRGMPRKEVWRIPDGSYVIEGDLDAGVVRYTQEVAEFTERLAEADERTRRAPLDEVERELERVREESTHRRGATA